MTTNETPPSETSERKRISDAEIMHRQLGCGCRRAVHDGLDCGVPLPGSCRWQDLQTGAECGRARAAHTKSYLHEFVSGDHGESTTLICTCAKTPLVTDVRHAKWCNLHDHPHGSCLICGRDRFFAIWHFSGVTGVCFTCREKARAE